jgi:hypothetical protein
MATLNGIVMMIMKATRLDSRERMRPLQYVPFGTNGKQPERQALIMFDAGSDYSFIRSHFARDQGYPEEHLINSIAVDTFGGTRLLHRQFAVELDSMGDDYPRKIVKKIYGIDQIIPHYQSQIPTSSEVFDLFRLAGYKNDIPVLQPGGQIDVLIGLDLAEYLPYEIIRHGSMILYESVWDQYKMLAGMVPTPSEIHHLTIKDDENMKEAPTPETIGDELFDSEDWDEDVIIVDENPSFKKQSDGFAFTFSLKPGLNSGSGSFTLKPGLNFIKAFTLKPDLNSESSTREEKIKNNPEDKVVTSEKPIDTQNITE